MTKIPFYIGTLFACFVPDSHKRHVVRGWVNGILYFPRISIFIKRIYGEFAYKLRFVRQHTPDRCVCIVNDKYYVKIFKRVPVQKLKRFAKLTDYVASKLDVAIPKIFVGKISSMYVCEKLKGHSVYDFDKKYVMKHHKKIENQVAKIIKDLQSINVKKIPDYKEYTSALQDSPVEKITSKSVLGHFDLNETNFLFDDDLNICGIIDWDGLRITNDKDKDMQIFMKYWNRYKELAQKF